MGISATLIGLAGIVASSATAANCWDEVQDPISACARAGIPGAGPCPEAVVNDATCPWVVAGTQVKSKHSVFRLCRYWVYLYNGETCSFSHVATFDQQCWETGSLSCPAGPPV